MSCRRPFPLAQAAAVACALVAAVAAAQTKPPIAPVKDVTDTHFGVTVHDPYRYMEDMKDPEVTAWMKAQADYTRGVIDRIPQRATLLSEVQKYGDAAAARTTGTQVNSDHVYYYKRLANENIPKLYVRQGIGGKERLLVDPEAMRGPEGKHYAIDWFSPSLDNKYVAYGLSLGGSEQSVLHVKDVATGKETGEAIDRANFGPPGWTSDHRLLYNRLQKMAPDAPPTDKYVNSRVYLHALGTDPEKDVAILGPGVTPGITIDPVATHVRRHGPWLAPRDRRRRQRRPAGGRDLHGDARFARRRQARLEEGRRPERRGDRFDADRRRPLRADAQGRIALQGAEARPQGARSGEGRGRRRAERVRHHRPHCSEGCAVRAPDERLDQRPVARRVCGGAKPVAVKLPFDADIAALTADVRVPGVIYQASAWTRFGGFYFYDPRTGKVTDTGLQPQGPYDHPDDLVATEVKVASHDGTLVPLSIVHKKGLKLDGSNPTILFGYGAYGISQTPYFRPTWLPWFRRGGIIAFPHVRGGGEYGEDWYKAGYKATKPNTWKDAIACAEWLIANKYTATPRLAIMGGSAGGIFVGRSITERPDLFGAAIDEVPVSDSLRMEFSENGVPNIPEFGTVKTEEGFKALYAMSSYHWVKDGTRVSRGAREHRHQRPARRRMGSRQDGGAAAGGVDQRQADPAAHRLRRRATASARPRSRPTRSAPTRSRSCSGNSA